jgi:hypothetical protein
MVSGAPLRGSETIQMQVVVINQYKDSLVRFIRIAAHAYDNL